MQPATEHLTRVMSVTDITRELRSAYEELRRARTFESKASAMGAINMWIKVLEGQHARRV